MIRRPCVRVPTASLGPVPALLPTPGYRPLPIIGQPCAWGANPGSGALVPRVVLGVDAVPLGDGDQPPGELVRAAEVDALGGALDRAAPAVSDSRNRRRSRFVSAETVSLARRVASH